MPDVITRIGTNPVPAEDMSSADQDTVIGNGTSRLPLQATGGGGGGLLVTTNQTTSFPAAAGNLYPLTNAGAGTATATLPDAAASGDGALVGFVVKGAGGGGAWQVAAGAGNTLNVGTYNLPDVTNYAEFISDGVSIWYLRSAVATTP